VTWLFCLPRATVSRRFEKSTLSCNECESFSKKTEGMHVACRSSVDFSKPRQPAAKSARRQLGASSGTAIRDAFIEGMTTRGTKWRAKTRWDGIFCRAGRRRSARHCQISGSSAHVNLGIFGKPHKILLGRWPRPSRPASQAETPLKTATLRPYSPFHRAIPPSRSL